MNFLRLNLYRISWFVVLGLFVALGFKGLRTPRNTPKAINAGPYCGCDGLLYQALGVSDGSRKLLEALPDPEKRSRTVVFWNYMDGNGVVIPDMISYLTWPQKIVAAPLAQMNVEKGVDLSQKASFTTAVFYKLRPPDVSDAKRIGPMFIVPLTGKSQ